jgi:hypothetical protein
MASGILRKMEIGNSSKVPDVSANYLLRLNEELIPLNSLIGKAFSLQFLGNIYCIKCGKKTYKSFGQGYCYPCFTKIPETEECVFRPELCKAHIGEARDMAYAQTHCLIDHYVYLAWSGGLKVGVTRHHQIPIRWLDQGATKAIILCKTENRYHAGLIEVELKKIFADKTIWQSMLKGIEDVSLNLMLEKTKALNFLQGSSVNFQKVEDIEYAIKYPVLQFPEKVKSFSFDKEASLKGILTGMKGQYLILDNGRVINIRNHCGYQVEIKTND